MSFWRYRAIEAATGTVRAGDLAGESAADVRASLRRIGLQVVDLRPVRRRTTAREHDRGFLVAVWASLADRVHAHLRTRRRAQRSEFYDSVATMLESGLSLLEALDTLLDGDRRRHRATRTMLNHLRESLRGGAALDAAACALPDWFASIDVAMIRSGQHGGHLAQVLRMLSERQGQADDLSHKLLAALMYPAVVSLVGIGVVIFLSVNTLPELMGMLDSAEIETPALTRAVRGFGQFLAGEWSFVILSLLAFTVLMAFVPGVLRRLLPKRFMTRRTWMPRLLRQIAVANAAQRLADLVRSGIPLVDSLRLVASTTHAPALQYTLRRAAERMEQGDDIAAAFDDRAWFDAEFTRLLELGQKTGDLDVLLERLAQRSLRRTGRLIERLTALLEPAVILLLAAAIGVVVLAAILPLVRLQEIL